MGDGLPRQSADWLAMTRCGGTRTGRGAKNVSARECRDIFCYVLPIPRRMEGELDNTEFNGEAKGSCIYAVRINKRTTILSIARKGTIKVHSH